MYEKLSPGVRKVITLANEIARDYGQEYVGTEHILLAIAEESTGIGSKILSALGAPHSRIKEQVDQLVKQSSEETWVFGRLPGTPHFKNVIAGAIEEARQLNSNMVCTEHVLLALMKEAGSVAFNALTRLGLSLDVIRQQISTPPSHPTDNSP